MAASPPRGQQRIIFLMLRNTKRLLKFTGGSVLFENGTPICCVGILNS